MATQDQIDKFHRFATAQLHRGHSEKSIDELFDQWRVENPASEEFDENVAAIQTSIDDMNQGHTGRNTSEVISELRRKLNLPSAE